MLEWFKTPSGSYNLTLILSIIAWFLAGVGIIAGFNHYKVKTQDATEKAKKADSLRIEMEEQLNEAKSELNAIKTPRTLTQTQRDKLLELLKKSNKGKVVITYLSVERDAESYAKELLAVLTESGYLATLSKHLWLQLAYDGIYICAWEPDTVPYFATDLQNAMKEVGIKVTGSYQPDFLETLKVPRDAVALVISNKKYD
ncbi:MAG: hypothetical protein AAFZ89_13295 [Bacteroidota bacterium]